MCFVLLKSKFSVSLDGTPRFNYTEHGELLMVFHRLCGRHRVNLKLLATAFMMASSRQATIKLVTGGEGVSLRRAALSLNLCLGLFQRSGYYPTQISCWETSNRAAAYAAASCYFVKIAPCFNKCATQPSTGQLRREQKTLPQQPNEADKAAFTYFLCEKDCILWGWKWEKAFFYKIERANI